MTARIRAAKSCCDLSLISSFPSRTHLALFLLIIEIEFDLSFGPRALCIVCAKKKRAQAIPVRFFSHSICSLSFLRFFFCFSVPVKHSKRLNECACAVTGKFFHHSKRLFRLFFLFFSLLFSRVKFPTFFLAQIKTKFE